jgi:LacI family transcriptional regulator
VATLYDVAQRAGVSIATVSRVLHGQDSVREQTRARVRAAIEELGYVPDGAAQSLARSRKDVVGLIYVARDDPRLGRHELESMSLLFRDEVMRGVESRLRARRWSLLVTYLGEDEAAGAVPDADVPVLPRLLTLSGKVDGLLIGDGVVSGEHLAALARRLPVVLIAGDPGQGYADVVAADNWSGTYALVDHLVSAHGRRRLFLVDGPAASPDAAVRRRAMEAVIAAHPGTELAGAANGQFSATGGERAAGRLLAGADTLPDAIVCANDQMAIGVLRRLADGGVRVPRDTAVVGFDDIFPAALCDPPLTTVCQPMRRIGERACERLFARIADPSLPPAAELLPAELVLRASCGCPEASATRSA